MSVKDNFRELFVPQRGIDWYREMKAEGRAPLREVRRGIWGYLMREYLEGVIERVDTGISPWCLEVAAAPQSKTAVETRVHAAPGMWWMAEQRLRELYIPYKATEGGVVAVRDPLHQVDLHYHCGTLLREMCWWALNYLSTKTTVGKRKSREKCLAAYRAQSHVKEEKSRAALADRTTKYVNRLRRIKMVSQRWLNDGNRVLYADLSAPKKLISELGEDKDA